MPLHIFLSKIIFLSVRRRKNTGIKVRIGGIIHRISFTFLFISGFVMEDEFGNLVKRPSEREMAVKKAEGHLRNLLKPQVSLLQLE